MHCCHVALLILVVAATSHAAAVAKEANVKLAGPPKQEKTPKLLEEVEGEMEGSGEGSGEGAMEEDKLYLHPGKKEKSAKIIDSKSAAEELEREEVIEGSGEESVPPKEIQLKLHRQEPKKIVKSSQSADEADKENSEINEEEKVEGEGSGEEGPSELLDETPKEKESEDVVEKPELDEEKMEKEAMKQQEEKEEEEEAKEEAKEEEKEEKEVAKEESKEEKEEAKEEAKEEKEEAKEEAKEEKEEAKEEAKEEEEKQMVLKEGRTEIKHNNINIFQQRAQECSPGPCCNLNLDDVPYYAWRIPQGEHPRDTLAVPRGGDAYPHQTSLIIKLAHCHPVAVRHKGGCHEIGYGGLHLFRCFHGHFRHVSFPLTTITALSCGPCL